MKPLVGLHQRRHFRHAWSAPRRPEVEQHYFALVILRKTDGLAFQRWRLERPREFAAGRGGRRFCRLTLCHKGELLAARCELGDFERAALKFEGLPRVEPLAID